MNPQHSYSLCLCKIAFFLIFIKPYHFISGKPCCGHLGSNDQNLKYTITLNKYRVFSSCDGEATLLHSLRAQLGGPNFRWSSLAHLHKASVQCYTVPRLNDIRNRWSGRMTWFTREVEDIFYLNQYFSTIKKSI